MLKKYLKHFGFVRTKWFIGVGGVVIGALLILVIRFATYTVPKHTHYHANFELYINGHREMFKAPTYYEEIAACTAFEKVTPAERAHMHDEANDVIHVHDDAVTWGQFFDNLRWPLGPNFIATPTGQIYGEKVDTKLHLILNEQDYTDLGGLNNSVIKDKDRLLISYGNETKADLAKQFSGVPSTAEKYDITKDPASCSGDQPTTIKDRLKHLF